MLEGFFDDSGTHGGPVTSVAGYAFKASERSQFVRKWRAVLKRNNVTHYRSHPFAHRQAPFDWKEEKRRLFIAELTGLLLEYGTAGFVATVARQSCNSILGRKWMNGFGNPYALCGLASIGLVGMWADDHQHYEKMAYVFEAGTKGYGTLSDIGDIILADRALSWKFRMQSLTTLAKADPCAKAVPLQAADLLAYEALKLKRASLGFEDRDPRWPIQELSKKHTKTLHLTDEILGGFVKATAGHKRWSTRLLTGLTSSNVPEWIRDARKDSV